MYSSETNRQQNNNFDSLINDISLVYTHQSGAVVSHSDYGMIPFARIWKCGNEAVGYNLGNVYHYNQTILCTIRFIFSIQE